jgi:hypothetical protein
MSSESDRPTTEDVAMPTTDESARADKKPAGGSKVERPYPRRTVEQAYRAPMAIREKNGGNPWVADQIAGALGIAVKSTNFLYIMNAARDFGLIEATKSGEGPAAWALTNLGRQAVYPTSDAVAAEAKVAAFLRVDIFRNVVEHYSGNNLPERTYLENTLHTTFGLDLSLYDEFVDLFEKNCRYVGIGKDWQGTPSHPGTPSGSPSVMPSGQSVTVSAGPKPGSPVCFVIMPFTEHDDRYQTGFFSEVLESIFTPALEGAGFEVRTAKRYGSEVIQSTIVNELLQADLVLADLTEHNPNVLFELGMRMNEDKPVALIRAKGTGPIFDVDNMLRVEEYNPNLWPSTVQTDIPKIMEHVKVTWDRKGLDRTFMGILRETQTS